jgi:hypothetical protein
MSERAADPWSALRRELEHVVRSALALQITRDSGESAAQVAARVRSSGARRAAQVSMIIETRAGVIT